MVDFVEPIMASHRNIWRFCGLNSGDSLQPHLEMYSQTKYSAMSRRRERRSRCTCTMDEMKSFVAEKVLTLITE